MRVEDIAAAAKVSPRTFNNYFSSKEKAFVFLWIEWTERIAATLRERKQDESLAVSLTQAFVAQYSRTGEVDPAWLAQLRLVISAPSLRGAYLKTQVASERPLAEAIAARAGTDVEHVLYPRVLAAAVSSAARGDHVLAHHWRHHALSHRHPAGHRGRRCRWGYHQSLSKEHSDEPRGRTHPVAFSVTCPAQETTRHDQPGTTEY